MTASVRLRQVIANGLRSPVREAGPRDGDEAVVFMHGDPGSGEDWTELLGTVGEYRRSVAVDMPGFGQADKPASFDYTGRGLRAAPGRAPRRARHTAGPPRSARLRGAVRAAVGNRAPGHVRERRTDQHWSPPGLPLAPHGPHVVRRDWVRRSWSPRRGWAPGSCSVTATPEACPRPRWTVCSGTSTATRAARSCGSTGR